MKAKTLLQLAQVLILFSLTVFSQGCATMRRENPVMANSGVDASAIVPEAVLEAALNSGWYLPAVRSPTSGLWVRRFAIRIMWYDYDPLDTSAHIGGAKCRFNDIELGTGDMAIDQLAYLLERLPFGTAIHVSFGDNGVVHAVPQPNNAFNSNPYESRLRLIIDARGYTLVYPSLFLYSYEADFVGIRASERAYIGQ